MAMRKCRECGQEVSSRAKVCPHCGVKKPGRRHIRATTVLAVVVGFFIVWAMTMSQEASPPASTANQTGVGGCPVVAMDAPAVWQGQATGSVNIRTGPGTDYPVHESGKLVAGETVNVLQACEGWLQARVVSPQGARAVVDQHGPQRAREMLLFWVRADLVRR